MPIRRGVRSLQMGVIDRVVCIESGAEAPPPRSAGVSPFFDDPFAVLDIEFDLERAGSTLTAGALADRPLNHWRYHELLPVEPDAEAFAWPVGWTPIIEARRLADWAGVRRLRLKDDGRNPTASFKDRASSVGVLHAKQHGATRIACASTGNAASSLAGYAAMAGLPATIFVPERTPVAKLTQLLIYGADVKRVLGTYAQAYDLCSAECDTHNWYNRNCAINPYLVEGKKTCGLEIAEQTSGDEPDWVVNSVGDGCSIAGVAKGLMQMYALGLCARVPRMLGVQAAGMDPIARAFETGEPPANFKGAHGSRLYRRARPRNWRKAVKNVRETDGAFARVTDAEIIDAMRVCARLAGVFAEPAAAAAVAGVKRAAADGLLAPDADVLAVITGNGLKDVATAARIAGEPTDVDPDDRTLPRSE